MAMQQLLGSSSQQDDTIEIRHRAMASCNVSSTTPLLLRTMGEQIDYDANRDTLTGEHIESETVPTIVTVEESSQTSEGNLGSLPTLMEPSSPLLGETFLDPSREFPLAVSTEESGRQLDQSTTEAIQITNPNVQVELIEDRDLQTPIAPPLTSLEGAMVIFPCRYTKGCWSNE